jgi:hypothetical protein
MAAKTAARKGLKFVAIRDAYLNVQRNAVLIREGGK